jgi:mRNA interferase RelE/StbE
MKPSSHRVEIAPAAERDLRKLPPPALEAVRPVILALADAPRPSGTRKLKGADRTYRIRFGPYRILYEVHDKEKLLVVLRVVRRSEVTYRWI